MALSSRATGPHDEMIGTDWYGTLPRGLYQVLNSHNVPPALYDELVEYFGRIDGQNWRAVRDYVKGKGKSGLNYGDVLRDRPERPQQSGVWLVMLDCVKGDVVATKVTAAQAETVKEAATRTPGAAVFTAEVMNP